MDEDPLNAIRARQERTERTHAEFGPLFERACEIFFRVDPMHLNFGSNGDEYTPEVSTILPRLYEATSEAEALGIVHQEFVRWFNERAAGPKKRYELATAEIWSAWQEWNRGPAA